jgi:cytochrome oxidase Cu insertion factor (SCO1/SenC/PrrC family)
VDPADAGYTYGVGVFKPEYTPPPPGSYALPPIDTVSDHPLVDAAGKPTRLFALTRDRVAIVAFVYTTCTDALGCPVSFAVLHALDRALAADPALARQVRLITISFDPDRDVPARMASMRRLHRPRSDWRFVTTRGEAELAPLLADFDQPVAKLRYEDGAWTGLFRHVLKVFLVDRQHRVRNVYSTGFLDSTLVLNDVRTLLGEGRK